MRDCQVWSRGAHEGGLFGPGAALLFAATASAQTIPTGYQEYFVTGHEQHVYDMMLGGRQRRDLHRLRGPRRHRPTPSSTTHGWSSYMNSVVGAVASADGQRIYYDQWEDGLDADVAPALGLSRPRKPGSSAGGDANQRRTVGPAEITTDPGSIPARRPRPRRRHHPGDGHRVQLQPGARCAASRPCTRAGTTATVTLALPHGWTNGSTHSVRISGANEAAYNATFTVTAPRPAPSPTPGDPEPARPARSGRRSCDDPPTRPAARACTSGPPTLPRRARPSPTTTPATARYRFHDGGGRPLRRRRSHRVERRPALRRARPGSRSRPTSPTRVEILSKQAVANAVSYSVPVGENIYGDGTAHRAVPTRVPGPRGLRRQHAGRRSTARAPGAR